MGLHQDPKASRGPAETARDTTSCLYRRHPDNGGVQRAGPGERDRSGFLVREPGLCDKQRQEHSRTNTRNRISGIQCKLSEYGAEPSIKEDKTNQIRYKTIMQQCSNNSQETVSIAGSNKSDSPCSIILSSATEKADHNIGQIQSQLRSSPDFRERRVGGTRMVVEPHVFLERQNSDGRETIADNRVRCLKKGLGSDRSRTGGPWSNSESQYHINTLEAVSAFHAIKCFAKDRRAITILLRIDNVAVVTYVNKLGGTVSLDLNRTVKEMWSWCLNRDISLAAEHLPGVLNRVADQESRRMIDRSDYRTVFQKIQEKWGQMYIDLFATRLTTQLDRFFSWRPDPEAMGTDAFTQDWTEIGEGTFMYANPPGT